MRISLAMRLVKDGLPHNLSDPHVLEKGRYRDSSITKYLNGNFISGHEACYLNGDVLSKRSYKSKNHDDPENESMVLFL